MRWWLLGSMVGLSLVGQGTLWAGEVKTRDQQPSRWLTQYEAARTLARSTGKPLCVVFRCEH